MKRKQIQAYFHDQMGAFEENFIESAFVSEKSIHQLRLSIKKLRTLMNLIKRYSSYPEKFHYQIKQITSLFKPLGAIRDNRNKAKMIEYFLANEDELKRKLMLDLDEKWMKSKSMYQEKFCLFPLELFFQFKIQFDNYLKAEFKTIKDQDIFRDKHDQIIGLMNQDDVKKNLHKIRSRVKELLFLLQICRTKQMDFNGNSFVTKDLASLAEFIGQWHDYELLINLYKEVNDQLHETSINEFDSIVHKSEELFDYVSGKLHLQFRIIR